MSYSFTREAQIQRADSAVGEFHADVIRGLSGPRKEIPSKYFYDEAGSKLFEAICLLPEYYLTRTELGILNAYALEMGCLLGPNCLLIEYGSGSSIKTRLLLDHLPNPAAYVPVDIAYEQLQESSAALAQDYPTLSTRPLCADFSRDIDLPPVDAPVQRRAVYFPGSTIGNLTPPEAATLLRRTADLVGPGGGLLLGADLKKDPQVLHDAYNDRAGVTAAFNLNLLTRINRELGGMFHTDRFWHHAFYDPSESRMEMHLVSRQDQYIPVDNQRFFIAEGESIRTEYSHKYSIHDLHSLASDSGFRVERAWTDEQAYFSVQYWSVSGQHRELDGNGYD